MLSSAIPSLWVALMEEPILSQREKRLLRRLARGYPDHAIAIQIGGRDDQVSEQRARLLQKLQLSSRSEISDAAARWAPWPSYELATTPDELARLPKGRPDGEQESPP
jgi:DNA-binding CsgD family transcriptional regulator